MTSNEYGAELSQDDPVPEEAPIERTSAGDYQAEEAEGGVSDDTGTVYGHEGEPETTPHDLVTDADDPTDPTGPNAGTSATADE